MIDQIGFSSKRAGELIALLKGFANSYIEEVLQPDLGDTHLSRIIAILLETYPEHYFDLVDLLGYSGGDAARAQLKLMAQGNSKNEKSWAIVNALNHVQSSRITDIAFLTDYLNIANDGGKLAALEGIASRLEDIGLRRQDNPHSCRDELTLKQIDHARTALRSGEYLNDSQFTEILREITENLVSL